MTTSTSVPREMAASVLVGPSRIELARVPTPEPGDRELLVRVDAVGVCGSDTHFYRSGRIGDLVVDGPVILGHETAGTVVAVGEGVSSDRIGQLVSIEPQRPCRRCTWCLSGAYNQCPEIEFYGAYPVDGSFAEYVTIPDDFAFAVPANMSEVEAALVEPLAVAVYAAKRAQIAPGDRVLVAGAGPIGLLVSQVARYFGASNVVIAEPNEERRAAAERLTGAEVVLPSVTSDSDSRPFDVFIDASGASSAIRGGVYAVGKRGRVVLVGMGMDEVEMPLSHIQHREITVTGTYRYAHAWPLALEIASSGQIALEPLASAFYDLPDVEQALLASGRDPQVIKAVVRPGVRG